MTAVSKLDNSVEIIEAEVAFRKAVDTGILSYDKKTVNFVGNWMYMYSRNSVHYFKNIDTRQYIQTFTEH